MIKALRQSKRKGAFILLAALGLHGCITASSPPVKERLFSVAELSDEVRDDSDYGCGLVDKAGLVHFMETADFESRRTVHDHFSLVGCSVTGKITINAETSSFVFDYGGVMHLGDGRILACGESCCQDGYEYCTWEASPGGD